MTTKRQKAAVYFCEEWLDIKFNGDINDFKAVSAFLNVYLNYAKSNALDAMEAYYSNFDY